MVKTLYTVRWDMTNAEGFVSSTCYLKRDSLGTIWCSNTIELDFLYSKETAEEILKEMSVEHSDDLFAILVVHYKVTQVDIDRVIKKLDDLNKEIEHCKDMESMQDGSLDFLYTQQSDYQKRLKLMEDFMKEEH